ncbi:tyrosine-type recombinase/integrase [Ktedonospora formicarum]|uniref:Site-specific tyrosine recombinase XerD n=1 Tax=Ktedonospora formicarum TaxID=2778364 RepID=A0A8J3I8P5_9CHLR|nr:tyrosine-type recombinase/integrase [Ktedonospora formicarum]GHO51499.1 site-specific tyrosine recombinase XerD [Ktedonospora formicarum]GHO51524.1 site-specific tyrosine recombinase XerD [Ktedonospora formicarum]
MEHNDTALTTANEDRISMQEAALEWLITKAKKTDSERTEGAYKRTLGQFDAYLRTNGSRLDDEPRRVARHAQRFAFTSYEEPERELSTSTVNQRFAILSSFYTYAMKQGACDVNPINYCERPTRQVAHAAPHLEHTYIADALRMIDTSTLEGKRDYALIDLAVTTGRRAAELAGLRWRDIDIKGSIMTITWVRCKGKKTLENVIGKKTAAHLLRYIKALYGPLDAIEPDAPIFVSLGNRKRYKTDKATGETILLGLSHQAIANIFDRRLDEKRTHTARHSFAVRMKKLGASIADIGDLLGHSNYAVTSGYMKDLLSAENEHIDALENAFGL